MIGVIECADCGLVVPERVPHGAVNYRAGSMHDSEDVDILQWRAGNMEDDTRRVAAVRPLLVPGDVVLDIGCGAGGFLHLGRADGWSVAGLELDMAACDTLASEGFSVFCSLEEMPASLLANVSVVTLFHVLEHLKDPRSFLCSVLNALPRARVFVFEVPCSEDPLLRLYGCEAFTQFTYWSHHEHLHSKRSLRLLLSSIFGTADVSRIQRYGLGNHLGWLAHGRPGGQSVYHWWDSATDLAYRAELINQGYSDTLWSVVSPDTDRLDA